MNIKKFYVGINTFVVRDDKLLLGKRKNAYGAGTWGLPGGHLETNESMFEAAARELLEETGLQANDLQFVNLVNDRHDDYDHYLQIGFIAKDVAGEPEIKEPNRCEEWRWFDLNDLPENIFPSHIKQIKAFIKNSNFSNK